MRRHKEQMTDGFIRQAQVIERETSFCDSLTKSGNWKRSGQ